MKRVLRASMWVALLTCLGCRDESDVRVIRLAHALDQGHSVHVAMEHMAELVSEQSGGRLRIQIYPSEQLGSERETLELVQIGSVGMAKVSAAALEQFSAAYRVFGVPYLFRDRNHQLAVLDGDVGKEILRSGRDEFLLGLAYYDSGSRNFYTKTRVERPSDLEGLKIRVMNSRTAISMVDGLGAAATPLALGELYTALQQGVVDGAENNLPSFHLLRHYEVCKYYVLDAHTAVPDVVVIGASLYASLSSQEKQWLSHAVDASMVYQRQLWATSERESLAAIQKAGVTVVEPDLEAFQRVGERLQSAFRSDAALASLMDRVRAVNPVAQVLQP